MRRRTTATAVLSIVGICLVGMPVSASAQLAEPPESHSPALSADGRWLAFVSTSDDLIQAGGSGADNGVEDAFVLDLQTGAMRLVSEPLAGGAANGRTTDVDVSADGRFVAFSSEATNLLPTDANGIASDVFVLDTVTDNLVLVSRRGAAGAQGDGESRNVTISDDGTRVAFSSYATNLVGNDTNGQPDAFVRDLVAGTTSRVSTNGNGKQAGSATLEAAISGNGAVVAFQNTSKLVSGDTNGRRDVYVKILASGKTQIVSLTNREKPANLDSTLTDISRNGRFVAFTSIASNLVPNDSNRVADAFVRDRTGGTTIRVSRNGNIEANGPTYDATISPDGAYVTITTAATNLAAAPDDNGTALDVFEFEMATGVLRRIVHDAAGGWPNGAIFDATYGPSSIIAFASWATDLAASDPDAQGDVFTREFGVNRDAVVTSTHRSTSAAG